VVILDEAQQLSREALEQIRILSTLETATRKLLQIALVGQPELEAVLKRPDLRQLDQRIAIRCRLEPLSRRETLRYVEHRLRIAGLIGPLPFGRGALARIYRGSCGVPRLISLICDRALAAAFASRAREVTPALAAAAIKSVRGDRGGGWWRGRDYLWRDARKLVPGAASMAGLLLAGAVATAYWGGWGIPSTTRLPPTTGSSAKSVFLEPVGLTSTAERARPGPTGSSRLPTKVTDSENWSGLLVQLLRLWGVTEDLGRTGGGAPIGPSDVGAIAARYQLSATLVPEMSLTDLRAVNLPAIIELGPPSGPRPLLLRRLDGATATLLSPSADEVRLPLGDLERSWSRSAWIVWCNVDLLPTDPSRAMTPVVFTTLAMRLHKLGLLDSPIPTGDDDRFREAVRRFQMSKGLAPDGLVGPRTTLVLARMAIGRVAPTLLGVSGPPD
jgi:general secretion pathway protein A